jgi:hypothetical protein
MMWEEMGSRDAPLYKNKRFGFGGEGKVPYERVEELVQVNRFRAAEFFLFRLVRNESRSAGCLKIVWEWKFGFRDSNLPWGSLGPKSEPDVIFLKQDPFVELWPVRRNWVIAIRNSEGEDSEGEETTTFSRDYKQFKEWFKINYPGLNFRSKKGRDVPQRWRYSTVLWSSGVQTITTFLLLALTRFKFGIARHAHALWLCIWLYGGPVYVNIGQLSGWKNHDFVPCRSLFKWFVLYIPLFGAAVVFFSVGAITVLCVELFGAMCGVYYELPVTSWMVIGVGIFGLCGSIILALRLYGTHASRSSDFR